MLNRPAGKLWSQMTPAEVDHFFKVLYEQAKSHAESAQSAREYLSKYLFTANTGAAAGMFLLMQSSKGFQKPYVFAFLIFCAGAFLVGVSHFFLLRRADRISDTYSADINAWGRGELTVEQIDARHHQRFWSGERTLARLGLIGSFVLLMIGGIVAAIPFIALI